MPPPSFVSENDGIGFCAETSIGFAVFFASLLQVVHAANKSANNNFFIRDLLGIEERPHHASSTPTWVVCRVGS